MSSIKITAASLLVVLLVAPAAPAAEPLADRVQGSIKKGIEYLRKKQEDRGGEKNWENAALLNAAWPGGTTSLAMLALLTSGVPANDPAIQRALPYLRSVRPQLTYTVALQAMVLAEIGEAKDLDIIQRNVDLLLAGRKYRDGKLVGWSYNKTPGDQSDNSNTQYALLGLLAGRQAGVKIDKKAWEEIQAFFIETQVVSPDKLTGGWPYQPKRADFPTHSMTVAGLSGLYIAGLELDLDKQQLDEKTGVAKNCGAYDENVAIARGQRWLGAHFTFEPTEIHSAIFYNIYGIERVGRLSGQRFIGEHDWYREGCELLCGVKKGSSLAQQDDGGWRAKSGFDDMPVISTSFALLFLSKGRTPILISKLAYDSVDVKKKDIDWNNKHHDARHLVEYASKFLFKKHPLAWQIFDPRRANIDKEAELQEELASLLQSPILYMNGHSAPNLTARQIELLRRYVDEGGFIFAEACCGDPAFADGFRRLMDKVFKNESHLTPMRPEHPIWSAHMPVDPKEFMAGRNERDWVQCIERGCKTVVVFTPQPLAGFWEEHRFMPQNNLPPTTRGEFAYRFAGNVIAYATGLELPKPRLSMVELTDRSEMKDVTRHALKLAQLKHEGDWNPAPQAMHVLANYLVNHFKLQVAPMKYDDPPVKPSKWDDLAQYKFMYMHGRREFSMDENQANNIRMNLRTGATLFADACCGSKEFDKAFRAMAAQLYPRNKLERIPLDDFLYSERLNGKAISTVKCRREKADGSAADYEDMAPELEGVKVGNRWVIIYSKYDIGCALEKNKSSACRGHDHDSAKLLAAAAVLYSLKDPPKK